jgi:hypothetical protein
MSGGDAQGLSQPIGFNFLSGLWRLYVRAEGLPRRER